MKYRHNKKRNTAFLFESLIRELTVATAKSLAERKSSIISILKKHLNSNTVLGKELSLYKTLYKETNLSKDIAEKLISETKKQFKELDKKVIFNSQTRLIDDINKNLGESVYDNFVPDYRELATINQLFYAKTKPKNQVLLEQTVLDKICSTLVEKSETKIKPMDKLALKTFFTKFNETYSNNLLEEQQGLLSRYITSIDDNGLELKVYLNEEIGRLRGLIQESSFFDSDNEMAEKKDELMSLLETYKSREIDSAMVKQLLSIQQLVCEIKS